MRLVITATANEIAKYINPANAGKNKTTAATNITGIATNGLYLPLFISFENKDLITFSNT